MAISDKLTYLNGTKTKIREGLNSLGADLDTQDTFRSYADAIEGIYEDYPKITGEGESLSLDNTKQASMKIVYKGNTSQNGTPTPTTPIPVNVVSGDNTIDICGKNLFDKNNANYVNGWVDGTTMRLNTINGNRMFYIPCKPNTTYTISRSVITSSFRTTTYDSTPFPTVTGSNVDYTVGSVLKNDSGKILTITTNANAKYLVVHYGKIEDTNLNESLASIQIEKGSTAATYEAYTGHSYPIYLGMKNLWNRTDVKDGFLPQSGSYPITMSSYPNSKYIIVPLLTGQKLTLSGSTSSTGRVRCIDKDTNQVVNAFTATETEYYTTTHAFGDAFYNATITAKKDFLVGIMDYVSFNQYLIVNYGATPQYISDTPIELCKIATYQDYIYKENDSWYLHKEIGKYTFTGNENIQLQNSGKRIYVGYNQNNYEEPLHTTSISQKFGMYSNKLVEVTAGNTWSGIQGVSYDYNTTYLTGNFDISINGISTLEEYRTAIVGIELVYILQTPTNTEITDTTLLEQLEESKLSYISQTNISQVNNDLSFILDVKALRGE